MSNSSGKVPRNSLLNVGSAMAGSGHSCWEEAGQEFYRENYSTSDADFEANSSSAANDRNFATLLPSKQTRNEIRTLRKPYKTAIAVAAGTAATAATASATIRTTATLPFDTQISLMPDLSENLPTEKNTRKQLAALRSLPLGLHEKREMRRKLRNTTCIRSKGLEKYRWSLTENCRGIAARLRATSDSVSRLIWTRQIDQIERDSGLVLARFFRYQKSLIVINAIVLLASISVLILPQFFQPEQTKSGKPSEPVLIPFLDYLAESSAENSTAAIRLTDFLTGTGLIENSVFFYGFYRNQPLLFNSSSARHFWHHLLPPPLETNFLLIFWLLKSYVLTGLFFGRAAFRCGRKRIIEHDPIYYWRSQQVFAAWPMSLTNTRLAAIRKNVVFENLRGLIYRRSTAGTGTSSAITTAAHHQREQSHAATVFFYNLFFTIAIGIEAVFFQYLLSGYYFENAVLSSRNADLFLAYFPLICMLAVNDLVPVLFRRFYCDRIQWFFAYSIVNNLVPVAIFWLLLMENRTDDGAKANTDFCRETFIGQFFYRLTLATLANQVVRCIVFEVPAKLVRKCCTKSASAAAFAKSKARDPSNSFALVVQLLTDSFRYQLILWTGLLFAPLLPLLTLAAQLVLFYLQKFSMFLQFPAKIHHETAVTRLEQFINWIAIVSFAFSVSLCGHFVLWQPVSQICGPFRDFATIADYVRYNYRQLPQLLRTVLAFFLTTKFALVLVLVLLLWIFYFRVVFFASRRTIDSLKQQLFIDGQDKQFLLDRLNSLVRRQEEASARKRAANQNRKAMAAAAAAAAAASSSTHATGASGGGGRGDLKVTARDHTSAST